MYFCININFFSYTFLPLRCQPLSPSSTILYKPILISTIVLLYRQSLLIILIAILYHPLQSFLAIHYNRFSPSSTIAPPSPASIANPALIQSPHPYTKHHRNTNTNATTHHCGTGLWRWYHRWCSQCFQMLLNPSIAAESDLSTKTTNFSVIILN